MSMNREIKIKVNINESSVQFIQEITITMNIKIAIIFFHFANNYEIIIWFDHEIFSVFIILKIPQKKKIYHHGQQNAFCLLSMQSILYRHYLLWSNHCKNFLGWARIQCGYTFCPSFSVTQFSQFGNVSNT